VNEHAHIEALDGVLEGLHAGRREMEGVGEGKASGEGWPPAPERWAATVAVTGWWSSLGLGLSAQLDLARGGRRWAGEGPVPAVRWSPSG